MNLSACGVLLLLSAAVYTLCSLVSKQRCTQNFSVSWQQLLKKGNMRTGTEIVNPCIQQFNRPITKFYNGSDVNLIAIELPQT